MNPWLMSRARIAVTCVLALAGTALGQLRVVPNIDLFREDPTDGRRPPGRFGSPENRQWQRDAQAAMDESPHLLVFADWRQLHGRLEGVTPTEVIWWNKEAKKPLHFPLSEVRKISIEGMGDSSSRLPDGPHATLKLADGSRLTGDLTTSDDGNFNLRLDLRSVLHIRRDQVPWIYFGMRGWPFTSFSGSPLELVGWLPQYDPPKIMADTMVVLNAGWTGFQTELPKRFELDFELPPENEDGTCLWLQPYGAQVNVFGAGTTMVRFGKEEIMWENYSENPVQKSIERTAESGPVAYRIFCDQGDRRVIVFRNGKQVADWIFSKTPLDMQIRGICFQQEDIMGMNKTLKIQRPRLQPWTGIVPGFDDAGRQDQFAIGKSEPTPGKLESITNQEFVFSGESHHLEPETILRLSGTPTALLKPTARVKLANWDDMNVRNLDILDGVLHCETAFAGKVEIPANNIYTLFFDPSHASREPKDILVFRNGDEIAGHLLAADANTPIRWKLLSGQEAAIEAARVAGIRLAVKSTLQPPGSPASVIMRNGDLLHGELVTLDEKEALFQHPVLGALHLDRSRIWQLFPSPSLQPSESGDSCWRLGLAPDDLPLRNPQADFDRWIRVDGTYVVRNCESEDYGDQRTWQGLSRDIPPGMERFEVRAYATSDEPSVTTVLFRLSSSDFRTNWRASLHQNILQVNMQGPRVQQPGWRTITMEDDPEKSATCRLVRIFVDLQKGTSDFYINGTLVERIGREQSERLSPGHYTVHVQPDPYESAPRVISNLWILPWSGDLPKKGPIPGPRTFLENGDTLQGAATTLRDGKFAVESDLGPLQVPIEKVAEMDFGAPAPEQAPGRLRLVDGSFINVDRFHWDGHAVTAHSGNLGDLHVPADAVSELVYGPKSVIDPAAVFKPPAASAPGPRVASGEVVP